MASLGSIQWHVSCSPLSTRSCPELGYVITIVPSWPSGGTFHLCGSWDLFHSIRITHISFTHTYTHTQHSHYEPYQFFTAVNLHAHNISYLTEHFPDDHCIFCFLKRSYSVGRVVEWCILLTTGPGQCWSLFEVRWGGHRSRG